MTLIDLISAEFSFELKPCRTGKIERSDNLETSHNWYWSFVYFQYLWLINLLFVLTLAALVILSGVCAHEVSIVAVFFITVGTFDLHSRRTSFSFFFSIPSEIISFRLPIELSVYIQSIALYHVTSMTPGINLVMIWSAYERWSKANKEQRGEREGERTCWNLFRLHVNQSI